MLHDELNSIRKGVSDMLEINRKMRREILDIREEWLEKSLRRSRAQVIQYLILTVLALTLKQYIGVWVAGVLTFMACAAGNHCWVSWNSLKEVKRAKESFESDIQGEQYVDRDA